MKIECKLRRDGGTKVELGDIEYHFEEQADGAHVADVTNEEHLARFLAIPEAYKIHGLAEKPAAKNAAPAKDKQADQVLLGSSVHPESFEINGKTYSLGDIVAAAHTKSGLSVEDFNGLSEDMRADLIDDELDALKADTSGGGKIDPAEELAKLKADYKAKFGKAPHHSMKVETIKAKLAE